MQAYNMTPIFRTVCNSFMSVLLFFVKLWSWNIGNIYARFWHCLGKVTLDCTFHLFAKSTNYEGCSAKSSCTAGFLLTNIWYMMIIILDKSPKATKSPGDYAWQILCKTLLNMFFSWILNLKFSNEILNIWNENEY